MFKLMNRNEDYLHDISPISAFNKDIINGEDILNITLDMDVVIEKKYRILVYIEETDEWKEFIVEGIIEDRVDGTQDIYAEDSIYETLGDFIEDSRAYNTTADIGLARALAPTRFEVGIVDDLGVASTNFYRTDAKNAIEKVCQAWKGELRVRIDVVGNRIAHRYVDLLQRRGTYLGERFVTGEDIEKITRTIDTDGLATALYGYGKGEELDNDTGGDASFGRRVDFADVNGGVSYVESTEARDKWGRKNPDGTRAHIFGKVQFDDIEDKGELLAETKVALKKTKEPLITYEGEIVGSEAKLGDTVIIIDKTYEPHLRVSTRILELDRDLLNKGNSKPVLGNYSPNIVNDWLDQEDYINNFRDKSGAWDKAGSMIDSDGKINAQYLNGIISELNEKMNSMGGYVYISEDGKGITTYNKPIDEDPNMAIQIVGGGFRIANSKNAAGEFEYRTFGNGDGFTADEIVAGILKGGKVRFDLTNGTLLIGNSVDDYSLYFDGNRLHMKLGSGRTIEEEIKYNVNELENTVNEYLAELEGQLDGKVDSWFEEYDPTMDNLPASEWNAEDRESHIGDLFYNLVNGYSYRFITRNGVYEWLRLTDGDITEALRRASEALEEAQKKKTVFIEQPYTPYYKGDLYARGEDYPLMVCRTTRIDGVYQAIDWKKASNGVSVTEVDTRILEKNTELKGQIDSEILQSYNDAVANAEIKAGEIAKAEAKLAKEYADTELSKEVQLRKDVDVANLEVLRAEQIALEERANSYADGRVTAEEEARIDLSNATLATAIARAELAEVTAKAWADGIVNAEEKRAIADAKQKLIDAKAHADNKATAARTAAEKYAREQDATSLELAKADATTKANAATVIANAAKTEASGAKANAEAARTAAVEADRLAKAAQVAADTDKFGGAAAQVAAKEAKRLADLAQLKANSATSEAAKAQAKADKAEGDAEAAKEAAAKAEFDAKAYADKQDLIVKSDAFEDAKAKADKALSDAKTDATNKATAAESAAKVYAKAKAEAETVISKAHADGIVTAEEKRSIADAKQKLVDAKADAKLKADAAEQSAKAYADAQDKLQENRITGDINTEIEGVVDRIESAQSSLEIIDEAFRLKLDSSEFQEFADGTIQLISKNQSDFEATSKQWDLSFTTVRGNNSLKNAVGFAGTKFWTTSGVILTEQNEELEVLGSGSAFLIPQLGEISQRFILETDTFYTFSFMYRMNQETARANIQISLLDIEGNDMVVNEFETYSTTLDDDYKLGAIIFKSKSTNMQLKIKNTSGSIKVSNIMINEGEYRQAWSAHRNEKYTTNVLTDEDGIKVKKINAQGRVEGYTEQTPFQFAGYYDDIEVFKMAEDVFRMNRAETKSIKIGNVIMATNGYRLNIGADTRSEE